MNQKARSATKHYQFSLEIVGLYKHMTSQNEFVLSKQLLRSGTSIGANVEEASAAQSRADFISKMSIASTEARETNYWLRLLRDSKVVDHERLSPILAKSDELTPIRKTSGLMLCNSL